MVSREGFGKMLSPIWR